MANMTRIDDMEIADEEIAMFDTLDEFDRMMTESRQMLEAGPLLVDSLIHAAGMIKYLHEKLDGKDREVQVFDSKLSQAKEKLAIFEQKLNEARKRFDEEKNKNRKLEDSYNFLLDEIRAVKRVLTDQSSGLPDSTMAKLRYIKSFGDYDRDHLDTINEVETTGSVLTDLSYTREEDQLLEELPARPRKKRFLSDITNEDPTDRCKPTFKSHEVKNGEPLVTTTIVPAEQNDSPTTTPTTEKVPTPEGNWQFDQLGAASNISPVAMDGAPIKKTVSTTSLNSQCAPLKMDAIRSRPHNFVQKAVLKGETCNACNRRIRFASQDFKCRDCKALVHSYCIIRAPLPCVPLGTTPGKKEGGRIGDYTPLTAPMVPPLVVHCIKEIEFRGLNEVGLYRIPGNDRDVKTLKEKLLRSRGVPNLSEVPDVHTIAGTLKEFLRTLKEPIITTVRWSEFVRTSMIQDEEERRERLMENIGELPQPNRDTLCFLILHLKKVAYSPEAMMGPSNLSTVFGPTVIGTSTLNPAEPFKDANVVNQVMLELINIPEEHYDTLLCDVETPLLSTPSRMNLAYFVSSPSTVKRRGSPGSPDQPTPRSVCIRKIRRPLPGFRYFETP
ncbi:hypothetical protein GE061_018682 [Apolygus lucorum]|uniref:Rho-GAP domain-containing protein n=1 Tax=Apolygus lucorum TaxID=248454 RepID=A0A8S9XFV6_APOLU|nr:hypothetical protein GE061_018682 [Apolygus lucorum]